MNNEQKTAVTAVIAVEIIGFFMLIVPAYFMVYIWCAK